MFRTLKTSHPAIVYFGNHWSAENRTSSHHIAHQLSQFFDVHYVECPGLRTPTTSSRDVKKLISKLRSGFAKPRRVSESLWVHTLIQLPLHQFRWATWANRRITQHWLRRLVTRHEIARPLLWFTVPHVADLAGAVDTSFSVYYCIDDYGSLPGVQEDAVRDMDSRLTACADVVFVASETLIERKRRLNPRTHLSPHGVDVEHFRAALDDGGIPTDIAQLPRPIVGFFGLIEKWIDLDLVEFIARNSPHCSFVMIGRVAVGRHKVMDLPNVHFLGQRPYEQLPEYGRAFDAAIIPYRMTEQVRNANPLKLREYLAMGVPVVTVRTPEIEKFSDVVTIADTYDEFLAGLNAILRDGGQRVDAKARLNRVAECSWEACVRAVLEKIEDVLSDGQLRVNPPIPSSSFVGAVSPQEQVAR
jgi:glycosyltransferase involved in cell wall biosynthesis